MQFNKREYFFRDADQKFLALLLAVSCVGFIFQAAFSNSVDLRDQVRLNASGGKQIILKNGPGNELNNKLPLLQIEMNQAGEAEWALLPGIGPVLSQKIVQYRTEHGPFQDIKEIENVKGIGPKKSARIAPFLRLDASFPDSSHSFPDARER